MEVQGVKIDDEIANKMMKQLNVDEENFKMIISNILYTFESVKDIFKKIWSGIDGLLEVLKVYEEESKIGTVKDYPPYKTNYRTVGFYTKKVYYNCRNTC